MKFKSLFKFILLSGFMLSQLILAGTTGKIKGRVIDKATGEPLLQVNVFIEGTMLGAATDFDGEYFILQVPPGEYSLKFSYIGYQTLTVAEVKVSADLTTEISAELTEQSYELEENVVVIAERKIIKKDITSSVQILGMGTLTALPVQNAEEGVMLQTGVFFDPVPVMGGLGSAGKGEKRYSVRGSQQLNTNWYIDGTRAATMVAGRVDWGTASVGINSEAIKEIQVNTGGFTAEYGNVEAAVINVVTKTGQARLHGAVEYVYGLPGQQHFGNYLYDPLTQKEFIDNTLEDGTLDPNWWTPERQNQIYDYTDIPDNIVYYNLNGVLPFISIAQNPVKFSLSGKFEQKAYSLPHPRDSRDTYNIMLNLGYQYNGGSVRLFGLVNRENHSTLQENGDFTNQAKYYRGWGSLVDIDSYDFYLQWNKIVNNELFFDLKLSSFWRKFVEGPSDYTQYGESVSPTLWGFHRYNGYEGEPFDQYSPIISNDILTGDISLTGSINWQIDNSNLIKSGFEFRYNTYSENEALRYPSFTVDPKYWINRGLGETYHPLQFAFYFQDKMEFEGMILNVGFRYDYFNPNYDWFDETNLFNLAVNPDYDPSTDPDGDLIDASGRVKYSFDNVLAKDRSPAKSYHIFSPRFGVSFPITENTLLHFNYGHYFQMPSLDRMFDFMYWRPVYIVKGMIENESGYSKSNEGDPERITSITTKPLDPGKTIMFEVGVKHNFWDYAVLNVTAFYKDMFNQTQERVGLFDHSVHGYDPFKDQTTPNLPYQTFLTGDYADSRGFEITLSSLFSPVVNFNINYSFSKSIQGRATPRKILIDEDNNSEYEWDTEVNKRIGVEKTFSRPHVLRVNLLFNSPEEWSSQFPLSLLSNMNISILYQYISGQAFTYLQPDDAPDTYNNHRMPASQTTDLRVEKSINLFNDHWIDLFVRVTNLFNNKNLRTYGDAVFDAEASKKYVEEGIISTVDGAGYDISWMNYFDQRKIYLGLKYRF